MNWHGKPGCFTAFWVLAVAVAGALEVYDGAPPGEHEDNILYQDNNQIYRSSPLNIKQDGIYAMSKIKNILLYKLMKILQQNDGDPRTRYRVNWITRDEKLSHETDGNTPQKIHLKDVAVKRLFNVIRGSKTIDFKTTERDFRPQQKWKIKKGKSMGSQMVCYFKLCAFRSPA